MNSRQAALREVESLCSAICDGTISDEQFARLQTYLRVSATARACYIRYIRTHNALLWVCARDDAPVLRRPATVSNVKSRPPAWQSAVTVVHSRESDGALHSRGTARSRRRTLTALGSAARVLAAILLVMGILSPPAR